MAKKTIYKYPFSIEDVVRIEMPAFAEILHIECQQGTPCIWALVEPEMRQETRTFSVFGTGHAIEYDRTAKSLVHHGTFQQGPFVWHVFEIN